MTRWRTFGILLLIMGLGSLWGCDAPAPPHTPESTRVEIVDATTPQPLETPPKRCLPGQYAWITHRHPQTGRLETDILSCHALVEKWDRGWFVGLLPLYVRMYTDVRVRPFSSGWIEQCLLQGLPVAWLPSTCITDSPAQPSCHVVPQWLAWGGQCAL